MKSLWKKVTTIRFNGKIVFTDRSNLHYDYIPNGEPVVEESCKFPDAVQSNSGWLKHIPTINSGKYVWDIYHINKIRLNDDVSVNVETRYESWDYRTFTEIMEELSAPEFIEYLKDNNLFYPLPNKHNFEINKDNTERKRKHYMGDK